MEDVLERAMQWAKEKHPSALVHHQAAFANSVQYLVTGMSGGYGGPSVREHAVSHAANGANGKTVGVMGGLTMMFPDGSLPHAGQWRFDKACEFADPICFGPITRLHFDCYRTEHCFDDSEEDLKALHNFRQRA